MIIIETFNQNDSLMERCPKFHKCNAPDCPLDPGQHVRDRLKGDDRCDLSKSRRLKIAKGSSLPRQGLTKLEWAARKRWESLPDDKKSRIKAHLRIGKRNYPEVFDTIYVGRGGNAEFANTPSKCA